MGVRQEKTYPHFLLTIYFNDFEEYLFSRQVNRVACDINYEDIVSHLKVLVLLYAVLFSTSEHDMQCALEAFKDYCNTWKLSVNVSKTKIIIFNSGKIIVSLV